MNRHFRNDITYAISGILICMPSIVSCDSGSRRAAMLAVLDEADSLNRSYIPITSDGLLKEAAT